MLSYVRGDLFQAPAQTLVNTVNTVGVMGKGIAKTFKEVFPEMFKEYQALCERHELRIGTLHLYRTPHKNVLNFPTKEHWRNPSRPQYIEAGLRTFVEFYERMGIRSVAFPPLGCGNGELDFEGTVRPLMERYLSKLPIQVFVYAPLARRDAPEHRQPEAIRRWLRSMPRELPFEEVWEDLRERYATKREVRTLTGRNTFEAVYVPEDDVIRIWASKTFLVTPEELQTYWTQLRDFGLLTASMLPESRRREASQMLPILGELPYVRRVVVGDAYESLQYTPTVGLQIAPADAPAPQRQLSLV